MDSEHTSGRPSYLLWLLPLLVLVSGLVLTALIAPRSRMPVESLANQLSRAHHEELSHILSEQISETLSSAPALASAEPDDFPARANRFLDEHPQVAGLELLTVVTHDQRAIVEKSLSLQNGQFIRFSSWKEGDGIVAADEASRYLVIRHALFQPRIHSSDPGLGLVATSVPHWRSALNRAQSEQRMAATTLTGLRHNGTDQSALRVFVPAARDQTGMTNRLIALVIQPDQWVSGQLSKHHDERWQVEIHDISQHARQPLAALPAAGAIANHVAPIRSTLSLADRQWMLSTQPAADWLESLDQQALWPAWLTGLTITLLTTALAIWAVWLTLRAERLLDHRTHRARHLGRQLDNTRVEKNILHHSLQESDRRTRDLIELGAGIFAELDETRQIGYISPQVATLLDIPSSDLIGSTLDNLVSEDDHRDLAMTFDDARRAQSVQRLDTTLISHNGALLPVALRIKALKDPLSGCSGFRVSLTPRS